MIRSSASLFHITFLVSGFLCTFAAHGAVSGTVIDPSGSPIEGARVVAVEAESDVDQRLRWLSDDPVRGQIAETTTDSKGNYTLELDEHLTLANLEISAPGRVPRELRAPHDGWIGATVLPEAKNLSGRVLSGGEPLSGALVILSGPFNAEIFATTDERGRFSTPAPEGSFTSIAVVHPDHAPIFEQRFRLEANLTLRLDRGLTLSGKAVAADGETAVEGARVMVDGWPLATSDDEGRFTVEHAPRTWTEARVSKGNLTAAVTRSTARSTTLVLRRAATVAGTIVDASSGRGIPHVNVSLGEESRFNMGAPRQRTHTDDRGQFSFPATLPGSYELMTSHPSWSSQIEQIAVVGDGDVERRIEVRRAATARGRTVDQRGEGVAAAMIDVEPEARGGFRMFRILEQTSGAHSAPDGRFVVFGIDAEQPARLVGSHRRHPVAKSERLVLDPGETANGANIVFPRGVAISGSVTTAAGDPVSGAEIRVSESQRPGPGTRVMMIRAIQGNDQPVLTDARGLFDVKVEEGTWDIAISADGFAPKRLNAVEVRDGADPLEVILEEGVVVQGRVVRAGAGIPDVMINAMSGGMPTPITTGSDGSFTITDLPRGPVTIMAVKPAEMIQEMRTVDAPTSDLLIEIPPGGAIRGRVVDESTGEAITDFQAGPSPDRGGGPIRIRVGGGLQSFHSDEGEFFIENVAPGRIQLIVEAPGYVRKTMSGIEVTEGETVDGLEVELSSGVRVTGTVRGDDGRPMSGVSVRIEDNEENPLAALMPQMMAAASTDSSGRYTIPAAAPGDTTFVFSRDGFVSTRKSAELKGKEVRVDATLSSGATVSGIVVTQAGVPVPGASISAVSAVQGSQRNSAESDAAGQFTIEGLAEGRYTFRASHPKYAEATREGVEVGTGEQIRLVMEDGGTIVGRILGADPSTYDSITVWASGSSAGGSSRSAVSPDGTFRIEAVQPGTTQVLARMGQMLNSQSSNTVSVEVTAGTQASVDLEFGGGSTITGRVTKFGEPLRSGFIRFSGRGGSRPGSSTSIDADGKYSVSGLERGIYDVFVSDMQTLSPYSETVEITSDSQTFNVDIRGGRITGRVIDATSSRPIESASISVERTDSPQGGVLMRLGATTSANGEFVIESVAEGSYRLRAERSGFGHATRELFVTEGRDESVELSLQPDEGLILRIVDQRDGRPLTADVVVYDAQNAIAWEGRPSPRGDGTIRVPVSSGSYRVTAWAGGYAPATVQISSTAAAQTIALGSGGALMIESRASASIRARLLDQWGMPHRASRWNRAGEITIAPGSNRFDNLAPGQYTIQVLDEAGAPVRSESVIVREGETASVSL